MDNTKKGQKEQDSKETIYIDANCFIYASLNKDELSKNAMEMLEKVRDGFYEKAYTSTLTIDEFLWRVQKEVGRELASEGASIFFNLENLEVISIDTQIALKALKIYKNEGLDPRDAIHLAAMQSKNVKTLISSDSDFDGIEGIKRIDFTK